MKTRRIASLTLLAALAFTGLGLCQSSSTVSADTLSRTKVGLIGQNNKKCTSTGINCLDCKPNNTRCTVDYVTTVCVPVMGWSCANGEFDCGVVITYSQANCQGLPTTTTTPCTGGDC